MPGNKPRTTIEKFLKDIQRVLDTDGISISDSLTISAVDAGVSIEVTNSPKAYTDGSGTITTGGSSQQIFAANADRSLLIVQNISANPLYVNFGAAAIVDSNSVKLNPDDKLILTGEGAPSESINIVGSTGGDSFVAKEG